MEPNGEKNFSDIIDFERYVCTGCNVLINIRYMPVSHEKVYQLIFPYTLA